MWEGAAGARVAANPPIRIVPSAGPSSNARIGTAPLCSARSKYAPVWGNAISGGPRARMSWYSSSRRNCIRSVRMSAIAGEMLGVPWPRPTLSAWTSPDPPVMSTCVDCAVMGSSVAVAPGPISGIAASFSQGSERSLHPASATGDGKQPSNDTVASTSIPSARRRRFPTASRATTRAVGVAKMESMSPCLPVPMVPFRSGDIAQLTGAALARPALAVLDPLVATGHVLRSPARRGAGTEPDERVVCSRTPDRARR